ncbi:MULTISPECIES: hypothetical protein [Saccharopolyspora]|uniref:Uncharacterized protein n=1 Tax=Saccharopolyspora endophytica TaxID=543886 RepID=A0ABS5DCK0_9PSEU|nr:MULTISPECIES: hypothetical protein [Saccharopolyspora]MBQ0924024.1 hypothetical protein [Saccharopolyspora endophytica]
MFVVVVAMLLVLVLGFVMFTDALEGTGSMSTRRGLRDVAAQVKRSARLSDHN